MSGEPSAPPAPAATPAAASPFPTQPLPKLTRVEAYMASTAAPGAKINVIRWAPPPGSPPPRAGLMLLHGFNHYAGPFFSWVAARMWGEFRIACFAVEHAGHGKSTVGVQLGFIPRFDAMPADVLAWARIIRAKGYLPPATPLFAHGESMGGAVALLAASSAPDVFAGLVLAGPMIGIDKGLVPPRAVQIIGEAIAAVWPAAPLAPVQDFMHWVFKDPVKVAEAGKDPVRYGGRMRLRTGFELRDASIKLEAPSFAASLRTPFLLQHGTADKVTSPARSRVFFDAATSVADRHLRLYEGGYHSLWWEPVPARLAFLRDAGAWVLARCGGAAGCDGDAELQALLAATPTATVGAPLITTYTPAAEDAAAPFQVPGDEWNTPWGTASHWSDYAGSPADAPEEVLPSVA